MQLLCDVIVIMGLLLNETVVSLVDYGRETVFNGLDYPDGRYVRFCL